MPAVLKLHVLIVGLTDALWPVVTSSNASAAGSLYLSKISGGSINETEAREILKEQGPIETLWFPSPTEREMFGLPDGIFIRFAFFDDCRDAVAVSSLNTDEVIL